jgi:protein-tyrosine phosphatase
MANVVDLQRADDPRDLVHRAVQVLAEGGVVGVPTETVYGLAASALSPSAVLRLNELRSFGTSNCESLPIAIAVPSVQAAMDYMLDASPLAWRLARRCWPGPVTLVVDCLNCDSAIYRLPQQTQQFALGNGGTIGIRVVGHPVFEQLHRFVAGPILLCSLPAPDRGPITTCGAMVRVVGERVPLLLDDGPTRYGGPSTVVRVHGASFDIDRQGVVEAAAIQQFAKPLLAIVCTGNTCRSPMAEVMMRRRLREATGDSEPISVISAGLAAYSGDLASSQAVEVMQRRGLDLTGHRSQLLTDQVLQLADLVLTMTRGHRDAILARYPEAAGRVFTLRVDGGDIGDPVGSPSEVYAACADQIDAQLAIWAERLQQQWLQSDDETQSPS